MHHFNHSHGFRLDSGTNAHIPLMRTLLLVFTLLFTSLALAGARESAITGTWIINHELTEEIAPDFDKGSLLDGLGGGQVSVSVMGIPLPRNEPAQRTSIGSPRDPDVLSCQEMILQETGGRMIATYQQVGEEEFIRGEFRGRTSNWSNKSLVQNYKTTERKVSKTYEIRSDGRMLVTVVVKPKKDKKRVYKRVFERATGKAEPVKGEPVKAEPAKGESAPSESVDDKAEKTS